MLNNSSSKGLDWLRSLCKPPPVKAEYSFKNTGEHWVSSYHIALLLEQLLNLTELFV